MSSGVWQCRFTVSTSFRYFTKFSYENIILPRGVCVLKKLSKRFLQWKASSVKMLRTFTKITYFDNPTHNSPSYRLIFNLKCQSRSYLWREVRLNVLFSDVSIRTLGVLTSQKIWYYWLVYTIGITLLHNYQFHLFIEVSIGNLAL